jgi:hypothetical protein
MVGTQKGCPNTADIERGFRAALAGAVRLTISADRLELFDSMGARVAVFAASRPGSPPPGAPAGTAPAGQVPRQ